MLKDKIIELLNRMGRIVCFFTLLLFAACSSSIREEASEEVPENHETISLTKEQYITAGIKTGTVTYRNMSSMIHANGMLDVPPQNLVTISPIMGGVIKKTKLLQGMRIRKGEVIATLQNPDFIRIQQEYLENISKLRFAELEFKREEELARENVSAVKTLQQVEAEYKTFKATHGALKEKLLILGINPALAESGTIVSEINIFSPISGYVTAVNVNIGKFVNPQDIICEIVDTEHLHVELTVFEKDVTRLKIGQKITFQLVNEADKERTASIYLINRKISEDRTVRVHAHLDKEDPSLIPNMYLKASIHISENKVQVLPEQAIVSSGEADVIYSLVSSSGETFEFKPVVIEKGVSAEGFTEVILPSGFDTRARIVTEGAYHIQAGQQNQEEHHDH